MQAFYSIRSERQLVERIDHDLLFRWFVGLGIEDAVWGATSFTKNRDRLLEAMWQPSFSPPCWHKRRACPGAGVVSREFSEELGRSVVVETSQTGAIVVGDEGVEVGIAFGMAEKAAVVGGAVLRHPGKMLAEAAVETLDHAPRLRGGRLLVCGRKGWVRRWVMARAAQVGSKRWSPEGLSWGFAFLSTAKRSVNSEPLSVRMVWTGSGKRSRKRSRKAAAVAARRSGRISR